MQFNALENSEMRLQVLVFKICNKWRPAYKDY